MDACSFFNTRFITADASPPPAPHNDNRYLMPEGETPAEFMQWVRQEKDRLRRELAADPRLLTCPEHRLTWDIRLAMEKCCLWHYYGVR